MYVKVYFGVTVNTNFSSKERTTYSSSSLVSLKDLVLLKDLSYGWMNGKTPDLIHCRNV